MADLARLIPGSCVTQRHGYLACSQRAARRRVVLGPGLGDVDNLVVRVETHARNQKIDKQRRDAPHLPHGAPCDCLGIDEYSAGPREMRQRLFRGGARVRVDDKYRSTSTLCPIRTRSGVWFNAGFGYGSLGCEDCGAAISPLVAPSTTDS